MSLHDRIKSGEFNPPARPLIRDGGGTEDVKVRHRMESAVILSKFKMAALEYVGLGEHPKREKAFELAWSRGHSNGLSEVLMELEELAELLL